MSKHSAPPRLGNDFDRLDRQHRVAKAIAAIILPLGIITIIGILAGLAIVGVIS